MSETFKIEFLPNSSAVSIPKTYDTPGMLMMNVYRGYRRDRFLNIWLITEPSMPGLIVEVEEGAVACIAVGDGSGYWYRDHWYETPWPYFFETD